MASFVEEVKRLGERINTGKESSPMEPKRIKVSSKRQITIPQQFYEQLGITDEVLCFVRDGEIVLRPVSHDPGFAEYILKDLIEQGYEGEELLAKFREYQKKIRPAVLRMLEEAEQLAEEARNNPDKQDKTKDIFADILDEDVED